MADTVMEQEVHPNPPAPPPATTSQNVPAVSLESDSDSHSTVSDIDSALGSMHSSRTRSVTSSVAEFRFENGRRYHSYDSSSAIYAIPNDENEQERLELQHHIWRVALDGRHYFSPIPKDRVHNVLDLGCGTGAWCIEVADEHPQAQVLGVDLSPIQPDLVPPNCSFLVDDCNADWIFAQKFDIIHTRAMTLGIKDWAKHARQAYAHLTPGGYIELQEICMPFKCTEATAPSAMADWTAQLMAAGEKLGGNFAGPSMLSTYLEAAGFVNITVRWQHWPVGPWAKGWKNKLIGRMFAADLLDGVPASSALMTRVLGKEKEEVDAFAERVVEEIKEAKKHAWAEICVAYGQKPEEP